MAALRARARTGGGLRPQAVGAVMRVCLAGLLLHALSSLSFLAAQDLQYGVVPTHVVVALDVSGTTRDAALRMAEEIRPLLTTAAGARGLRVVVFGDHPIDVPDPEQLSNLLRGYPEQIRCVENEGTTWDSAVGTLELCSSDFAALFRRIAGDVTSGDEPYVVWILSDGAADRLPNSIQPQPGCERLPAEELTSRISTRRLDIVLVQMGRDNNCSPQRVRRMWEESFSSFSSIRLGIETVHDPAHLAAEIGRSVYPGGTHRVSLTNVECSTQMPSDDRSEVRLTISADITNRYDFNQPDDRVDVQWRWRVLRPGGFENTGNHEQVLRTSEDTLLGGGGIPPRDPRPTAVEFEYFASYRGRGPSWHWNERALHRVRCGRRDATVFAALSVKKSLSSFWRSSRDFALQLNLERDASDEDGSDEKQFLRDEWRRVRTSFGDYGKCAAEGPEGHYALKVNECTESNLPSAIDILKPRVYAVPLLVHYIRDRNAWVQIKQAGSVLPATDAGVVTLRFIHIGPGWMAVLGATAIWIALGFFAGLRRPHGFGLLAKAHVCAATVSVVLAFLLWREFGKAGVFDLLDSAGGAIVFFIWMWAGLAVLAALLSIRLLPRRTREIYWTAVVFLGASVMRHIPLDNAYVALGIPLAGLGVFAGLLAKREPRGSARYIERLVALATVVIGWRELPPEKLDHKPDVIPMS